MRAFEALLTQYVRAAAAHHECARLLALGDAERTTQRLSPTALRFAGERVRRRAANRLAMERLGDQLATLTALVELAYERMIAPQPLEDLEDRAEVFLDELEHVEETAHAAVALRADELETHWSSIRSGQLRSDPNWSDP
jgi:hypothetical protein